MVQRLVAIALGGFIAPPKDSARVKWLLLQPSPFIDFQGPPHCWEIEA
jgi:hypothetical protein